MSENPIAIAVREAFKNVEMPDGGTLADYKGLSDIIVTKSAVALAIAVEAAMEKDFTPVQAAATKAAEAVCEGRKVMVSLTANRAPSGAGTGAGAGGGGPQQQGQSPVNPQPVNGIKHIIAVASGKGGVGKSTCAVNMSLALSAQGLRVGILDADLYGPSIPKMLGIEGKPAFRNENMFAPFEAFGVKAMSVGPMVEDDQAVVWRGPIATSALRQLLRETDWGELDVLIIDLPPGTGDIQISLCQQVALAGAVIVSTPQDMSLIDAKRALNMFQRMQIPILGVVENMSYFVAPDTGSRYDIFGHGGARAAAEKMNVPFLGEVPLHMSIREKSDTGNPVSHSDPDGPEALSFKNIATSLVARIPGLAT
ncbi:[4Fe-4S] cluster assembly scaffold protein Mrp (=ApbC) [hydrothermal vent metagenome]|uniref:[4Fe-4S] cluster assembly scaffold protein Mrp (=ApbC) n=1 Tax=hydrothermal vent metagenome TaxID=652676 RepID=A0A3B0TWL1_9ZZZZ